MAQENPRFGEIIPDDADVRRDAVHVAVVPCVADTVLLPGDHVGLVDYPTRMLSLAKPMLIDRCIGIVDPFLKEAVQKGQRFYLFLYPNTVVGMRHHWSHPSFDDAGV